MNRRHVAVLTTIVLVIFCSVQNARDARADTAGGALTDATGASTQSQARMRYITAGDSHTCIVLSDNSVKCFGMGSEGQLGSGTTDNIGDGTALSVATSSAVSIGASRTARSISAGASHTCALLDNATVKVVGLKVKVVSALVPIATVRSSSLGSGPDWQSLNLLRRVVVEARPGT